MNDILIPVILLLAFAIISLVYIRKFKKAQLKEGASEKRRFWNNSYVFESIPSIFPILGIFCTALGITMGIWHFDTDDIQSSIPGLLAGLKVAFVATMLGIVGLLVFQQITAHVQQQIDEDPERPLRQTDEIAAISAISQSIMKMSQDNKLAMELLKESFGEELRKNMTMIYKRLDENNHNLMEQHAVLRQAVVQSGEGSRLAIESSGEMLGKELGFLRKEQFAVGEKANKNTDQIIKAMKDNNDLIAGKFNEFSELLSKNNTEALVDVMRNVTEQFNTQMDALISKLVQENFEELNRSVNALNIWQQENKVQIGELTSQYVKATESFKISGKTLEDVARHAQALIAEEGRLEMLVKELQKVMIEDGKYTQLADKVSTAVDKLSDASGNFEETTRKLNEWVKNDKNFRDAAQILITKLEEFRDLNGDVWTKYRQEMQKAVSIVKETSTALNRDLSNINASFYERLNDTLANLDLCIQRFIPPNRN